MTRQEQTTMRQQPMGKVKKPCAGKMEVQPLAPPGQKEIKDLMPLLELAANPDRPL